VRRKSLIYFSLLGAALSFFGLAACLTVLMDGDGDYVGLGLSRFVVICLGIGCSIGTWLTAVAIASIHKKTWALYVTVAVVLVACLAFATICYQTPRTRV
jgi:hypothetical protein